MTKYNINIRREAESFKDEKGMDVTYEGNDVAYISEILSKTKYQGPTSNGFMEGDVVIRISVAPEPTIDSFFGTQFKADWGSGDLFTLTPGETEQTVRRFYLDGSGKGKFYSIYVDDALRLIKTERWVAQNA